VVAAAVAELPRPPPAISGDEIGRKRTAARRRTDLSAAIYTSSPPPFAPISSASRGRKVPRRYATRRRPWCCDAAVGVDVEMMERTRLATPGQARLGAAVVACAAVPPWHVGALLQVHAPLIPSSLSFLPALLLHPLTLAVAAPPHGDACHVGALLRQAG
jgi:hypothetical protein